MCTFLKSFTAPPRKLLQHPLAIWAASEIEAPIAAGSCNIDKIVQAPVQMQLTCNQVCLEQRICQRAMALRYWILAATMPAGMFERNADTTSTIQLPERTVMGRFADHAGVKKHGSAEVLKEGPHEMSPLKMNRVTLRPELTSTVTLRVRSRDAPCWACIHPQLELFSWSSQMSMARQQEPPTERNC